MTDPKTWPASVSSMAQAAALMGVPKPVLRRAKAMGCPGFVHSRVHPRDVAPWLVAQGMAGGEAKPNGKSKVKPQPDAPRKPRDLAAEIQDLNTMLEDVDRLAKSTLAAGDVTVALQLLGERRPLAQQRDSALIQARRAGRTEEDAIGRADVERIAYALALQSCHALQRIAREAVGKLIGLTDPAEILSALEGQLIPAAFMAPFRQATQLEAGHGLPAWVADAMERASKELVE